MKATTKIALLLTAAATAQLAQAQAQYLEAGVPCIVSGTPAAGTGTMSYQWYRNNEPIAGATEANYIVPDVLAHGANVEFKRRVISNVCPGNTQHFTNVVTVTFNELVINHVRWAPNNVAQIFTFASRPDMYTEYFQWNGGNSLSTSGGNGGWYPNPITNMPYWDGFPCPEGWRVPTLPEYAALNSTGSSWAAANTKGNAVAGRFIGPNHAACKLPSQMYNCIFLPAGGRRDDVDGSVTEQGTNGYYWTNSVSGGTYSFCLGFTSSSCFEETSIKQLNAVNIRCVKSEQ